MKLDPALLHVPKAILPGAVAVMHGHGGTDVIEQLGMVQDQFFGEDGFATAGGSHDQDTGRGLETERFSHQHHDSLEKKTKMSETDSGTDPFINNNVGDREHDTHGATSTHYKSTA